MHRLSAVGTDREEIFDLAVRYCTAIDTRDWELLGRCFDLDAVVVYPGFEPLVGVPALTEFLAGILGPLDVTQHIATNFAIEIDGDRAKLTSYLHAQHVRAAAAGGALYIVAGTYRDELDRGPAGWRITRRELTTTWTDGNPAVLG